MVRNFITICTHDREEFFGKIKNKRMKLNEMGKIVDVEWKQTEKIRTNVKLDAWMIMPNHLHGILVIENEMFRDVETPRRGVSTGMGNNHVCTKKQIRNPHHKPEWKPNSVGSIINQFKSVCTKRIHKIHPALSRVWQPRFHDRVIRDEKELDRIRKYIWLNPERWENDRNNLKINLPRR